MGFTIDVETPEYNKIKVIGVGGAGGNAVNNMINAKISGVDTIVANTDKQVIDKSLANHKIILGEKVTKFMGAGGNPETGKKAAEESRDAIADVLRDTDMLFIVAGMGGGTGTGAAPVVAQIARELNILTVAIVTKPFKWEGRKREKQADEGIKKLERFVDSIIVIPNARLKKVGDTGLSFKDAFSAADDVLCRGVKSISETIVQAGYINLDFADIRSVMENSGHAYMGIGSAKGADCGIAAVNQAISSPLLETDINGAKGVIINFTSSIEIPLNVLEDVGVAVQKLTSEDCNIIFGTVSKEDMGDEVSVTVIATGYDDSSPKKDDDDESSKDEKSSENSSEKSSEKSSNEKGSSEKKSTLLSQNAPVSADIFSDVQKFSTTNTVNDIFGNKTSSQSVNVLGNAANELLSSISASAPGPFAFGTDVPVASNPTEDKSNKNDSPFDDDDDDEEDFPIFKGRNIFDQ